MIHYEDGQGDLLGLKVYAYCLFDCGEQRRRCVGFRAV